MCVFSLLTDLTLQMPCLAAVAYFTEATYGGGHTHYGGAK